MRLIDADKLLYDDIDCTDGNTYMVVYAPQIDNAPTAFDLESAIEQIESMAKKAFYEGMPHAQTKGKLNKWITSLYFKNVKANNIRLYGNYAYIFAGETLVTVIPVPVGLRKDLENMIRR